MLDTAVSTHARYEDKIVGGEVRPDYTWETNTSSFFPTEAFWLIFSQSEQQQYIWRGAVEANWDTNTSPKQRDKSTTTTDGFIFRKWNVRSVPQERNFNERSQAQIHGADWGVDRFVRSVLILLFTASVFANTQTAYWMQSVLGWHSDTAAERKI